jgi:hypothetical protein
LPRARPTHWKACGKTKPAASGTRRYIDGQPMKAPGVDDDGALGRSRSSSAMLSVRGSSTPAAWLSS